MNISHLLTLIKSQFIKHLTVVFSGNVIAAGLGFIAVLIISKELSVSDFGLFNIAVSAILVTSRLSSLGMDTTLIRFASPYLILKKKAEANYVFRTMFLVRIIISALLMLILLSTAGVVSKEVFHHAGLTSLLKLAAFGGLAVSLLNYLKAVLHAYQLFNRSVALQLFIDCGKLIMVVVVAFYGKMSVFTAVAIFAFIPFFGVMIGFGEFYQGFFSEKKPVENLVAQMFSYSKWMFISSICNLIIPYIGTFMISRKLGYEAVGIYGLAMNLTYIFPIIIYSLHSVLLPKVSRFREVLQFQKYITGSLKISFLIGMIIIPFLFLSSFLIRVFFGVRYLDSVPVFHWFLLSYTILTINTTIQIALYSINKPSVIALMDIANLVVMVAGCYILIPFLGVIAPALLMSVIHIGNLGFLSLYTLKNIRNGAILFQEKPIL